MGENLSHALANKYVCLHGSFICLRVLTSTPAYVHRCTSIQSFRRADAVTGLATVTIISRSCLIAADVLLIAITWWCLPRHRVPHIFRGGQLSFTNIVLRDGEPQIWRTYTVLAYVLTWTGERYRDALFSVRIVCVQRRFDNSHLFAPQCASRAEHPAHLAYSPLCASRPLSYILPNHVHSPCAPRVDALP